MNIKEAYDAGKISESLRNTTHVQYHRTTPEGATHYLDVDIVDAWHTSGRLKKRVVIGGLVYTRG